MTKRDFMTWFALGHLANDWPIAALWLVVPAAGVAMDLSPAEVGLLFTLFSVGGALTYVPAGFLADSVSNRGRLLVVTFWWVALGYTLAAMAPGFWSLAILLAVAGMGNAAWHPIATGVLTRDNKRGRARALGIHAIGGSFAEVLAPLSVGLLLSVLDWRGALVFSVVPTVLMGLCFVWVARSVPVVGAKTIHPHDLSNLIHVWRTGEGLRIVAMMSLYNMSLIALLSMIPLYLATVHLLPPATVGVIFSSLLITGALAQPWIGWISDTIGRRRVIATGNGLAAFAFATLIFELPFWLMIGMIALGIAALDAIRAVVLAAAADHTDRHESTTLGFAFALLDGVGALGAVLAGIAAGVSWGAMFGLAATLAMGAAILGGKGAKAARGATWREYSRSRHIKKNGSHNSASNGYRGVTIDEAKAEHARRYWFT